MLAEELSLVGRQVYRKGVFPIPSSSSVFSSSSPAWYGSDTDSDENINLESEKWKILMLIITKI